MEFVQKPAVMTKTYVANILMGAVVGTLHILMNFDQDSLFGILLLILLFLSFAARLIIAQAAPPFQVKKASIVSALIMVPVFLFAAFADFAAVFSSLSLLSDVRPSSNVYTISVIGGIFGSIGTIILEAKIAFTEKKQSVPESLLYLSRIVLYLYCALGVTLIWEALGDKLLGTLRHQDALTNVLYLFIFYFLAIIPFQRHAFLDTILRGKSVAHYFLSMFIGFSFVAWSMLFS